MSEADRVAELAADAALDVIFSRCDQAAITDVDVSVTFEEQLLEIDVYLEGPSNAEQIADDAALAARAAADDYLEGT